MRKRDLSTLLAVAKHQAGKKTAPCPCLVPTYLPTTIPTDPEGGTSAGTRYTIARGAAGRYTVCAPEHEEPAIEGSATFCMTR